HIGDSRDAQAVRALERAHGGDRFRPDDRVDRTEVETLCAQRNLQPRVLGIEDGSRRPSRRQSSANRPHQCDPQTHEVEDYAAKAGTPASLGPPPPRAGAVMRRPRTTPPTLKGMLGADGALDAALVQLG